MATSCGGFCSIAPYGELIQFLTLFVFLTP
nr:MAG TPA: hypothetical protein [Caudoviricetes sp.]